MSKLCERTLWRNKNIDYLFNYHIYEYDIKSAGFNIIKYYKLLPNKEIEFLEKLDKKEKQVKIGLIQKSNKEFTDKLSDGFKEIRKLFIESNALNEDNILSIKKDALFVIDNKCKYTKFNNIEFILKNTYTSYIILDKIEFYINTRDNKIDIKGLGQDHVLEKIHLYHDKYILDFILKFIKMKENNSESIEYYISKFIRDYRNRKLDIEYYRELSSTNTFKLLDKELNEYINIEYTNDIYNIDITYNYLKYIVPIASLCI